MELFCISVVQKKPQCSEVVSVKEERGGGSGWKKQKKEGGCEY